MQAIDRAAIERLGIPRLLLMDHAGLAVAREAASLVRDPAVPILICSGTGYNGGDGLSAARHLQGWGYRPRVVLAGALDRLREEPLTFARIAQRLHIPLMEAVAPPSDALAGVMGECGLIVDALLGIGAQGRVRQPHAALIELMNRSGKPILAVDIPSGIDADTGAVQGVAVQAAVTVAFGRAKQGCLVGEGPAHAGRILTDPITIPQQVLNDT